jgi:hypothetical protein
MAADDPRAWATIPVSLTGYVTTDEMRSMGYRVAAFEASRFVEFTSGLSEANPSGGTGAAFMCYTLRNKVAAPVNVRVDSFLINPESGEYSAGTMERLTLAPNEIRVMRIPVGDEWSPIPAGWSSFALQMWADTLPLPQGV